MDHSTDGQTPNVREWAHQPILYHAFMIQTNGILDDRFDLRTTCFVRVKGRKGINVTNTIRSVLQPLN